MIIQTVFFFNDTATTEIYTLSLHDALPIWHNKGTALGRLGRYEDALAAFDRALALRPDDPNTWHNKGLALERSEEHTSELQSRQYLVCRLLLEKKKKFNSHSSVQVLYQVII